MNTYDYGIVIGRFQPFHLAHHKLIQHALSLSEKVVVILGSARSAPDIKNPFTPSMREEMIRACFPEEENRLIFHAIRDYPYNDNFWVTEIQNGIAQAIEDDSADAENKKIALVGYFKDRSSYYLNLFPQLQFEEFYVNPKANPELAVNATEIRESYFSGREDWVAKVPEQIATYMRAFQSHETFEQLKREFEYLEKYKKDTRFVGVPFDPVFLTTDVVVVSSGHILVIRRGHQPGKGLLALPGGFLQKDMTLEESALKELKEETRINVPASVLKGSIKAKKEFDYPERSQRGRTITFAYFLELQPSMKEGLPKVKGGDDAAKAFWLPLSALGEKEDEFFEDHLHIIKYFVGL